MKSYICDLCGYIYDPTVGDPDNGIEAGTAFEDLPEDWVCPLCGAPTDQFSLLEETDQVDSEEDMEQFEAVKTEQNKSEEESEEETELCTANELADDYRSDAFEQEDTVETNQSNEEGEKVMKSYVCDLCGYVYDPSVGDPDNGVEPGTAFADLPEDWVCPLCGAPTDQFSEV